MGRRPLSDEEKALRAQRKKEIKEAKDLARKKRAKNKSELDIDDPLAARDYCSITIKFNKFEHDRLTAAAEREGVKIIDFIRSALKERAENKK